MTAMVNTTTAEIAVKAAGSPELQSFVATANDPANHFPIQNVPFCVYKPLASGVPFRIGVGIGDQILDVRQAARIGILRGLGPEIIEACQLANLNALFDLGRSSVRSLRDQLMALLSKESTDVATVQPLLLDQSSVEFGVPFEIGDYTDFFASVNHATNVGKMYRPETPLLPNFKTQPLAYHGRASSVIISGEPVERPRGIYRDGHGGELKFGSTARFDFEVEIGAYIGRGNLRNSPISIDTAEDHVAGICIVNDWSARDIQAWESQPLGPFLGKNFATSVSPWVVTLDALEPHRSPAASEVHGEAALADYLHSARNRVKGGLAIELETYIQTAAMRSAGIAKEKITATRFDRDSYWTLSQMVAHHTINGCNLRSGDLLASGTLSGPSDRTEGCLLELTRGGTQPLVLGNGESRRYLEDGDEVTITAFCALDNGRRIGFGNCTARIAASQPLKTGSEKS
jgi:fumarylacetoacetase